MKKIITLLLLSLYANIAIAQEEIRNTIIFNGNQIPLSEALKQIEKSTGCTLVFSYDDIHDYVVSVSFEEKTVQDALNIVLTDLPFKYIYKEGCYIISKNKQAHVSEKLQTSMPLIIQEKGISGKVTDDNKQPVEAALVWLVNPETEQSIAQAITDDSGNFFLPCINKEIKLTVTCLGYTPYVSEIFNASKPVNRPTIILSEKSEVLDNIVVIGEKSRPVIEQKAGKLIFNVENSINAQGSNAFEILRQTPGVSVDEGSKSISINGRSGVLVMLNGKQTYMQQSEIVDLLKSTSSSNIKMIEVMSNATAQYDAAGSGGILNIVLKKERGAGYNVMANVGMSYWFHVKQNTELSFNYNRGKLNFYGNYSHDLGHVGLFYGSTRKQSGKLFESHSDDVDKRNIAAATLGLDYEINKHHLVGIQANGNFLFGPGLIETNTDIYNSYDKDLLLYTIRSKSDYYHQVADRYNFNANYRYEVPDERLFTFDLDYGLFRGNSGNYQPNEYYSPMQVLDSAQNYRSTGNRDIDLYALSSGYKQSVWLGELMGGMKFSNVSSKNTYSLYDVQEKEETIDQNMSNDFHYIESILAGFIMYDLNISDKWYANIGARIEYTHSNGHLIPLAGSMNQESNVRRDYVDFFPSLGITYKPKEKHTISISYGKRIDRPVYSDLNPIEQPLDGLASWKGNPFLIPQKTHRFSLQYQYDKTSVELSYSRTNDYRVQITDTLGVDKVIMEPQNLGTQEYYGMALSQSLRFFHAWDINFSGRAYHLDNRMAFDAERFYHRKRWAAGVTLQTSFPVIWGIRSEILGVYATKRLGGSTEVMGSNGLVNLGFQKKFINDKAIVKLSFSDIFWTNNWDNVNNFGNFQSKEYGYGETRQIKVNFTYKFGGSNKKHTKQSNVDAELNRF